MPHRAADPDPPSPDGEDVREEGAVPAAVLPSTPHPRESDAGEGEVALSERRAFLGRLALGLGALSGGALLVPWAAVFLTPAVRSEGAWRPLGPLGSFPLGETRQVTYRDADPLPWAGFVARNTAWLRRDGPGEFTAFSAYCSHVGCPIRWEEDTRLFLCPCHGGAFHADGTVASGPPPRPLARHAVRVRDGMVEILTTTIPRMT